jgi:hypothetical protein
MPSHDSLSKVEYSPLLHESFAVVLFEALVHQAGARTSSRCDIKSCVYNPCNIRY